MVNVLFMQSQSYFGSDSGIQALLLRHFDRNVVRAHVALTSAPLPDPDLDSGRRFQSIPGIRVRPTNFGPSLFEVSRMEKLKRLPQLASVPWSLLSLSAYVRQHGIQIIHGTEKPRDAFYGVLLGKLSGAKSVVHLHVKYADWIVGGTRWALEHADAILGVSPFVAQSVVDAGFPPEKVYSVVNAIDLVGSRWDPTIDGRPARRSLGLADDTPLIGITSRLFPWKGHHHLIDALAIVKQRVPDVKLAIVGDDDPRATPGRGSYSAELKAQVRRLNLDESVIFTGFRKDVPELMAAFDIFAMPTWEEPCAVAFLEAMAMAKPVVAWASGGTPEMVVDGETGLLVEPHSPHQLADALTRLLADPNLRRQFGRAGRRRVEEVLNPQQMCAEIVRTYQTILERPSHQRGFAESPAEGGSLLSDSRQRSA